MNLNRSELRSAIIGMVIGDGNLTKRWENGNANFQMSHCEKQYEYLMWKKSILDKITQSTVHPTKKEMGGKTYTGYHLSSYRHPIFTKLYNRFYHEGHKVLDEYIVKSITPLSLAILYMDDGCFGKHHAGGKDSFFLCTQSFDYANQLLLKKSLKIKFDLDWNLNKAEKAKDDSYNYRLRLANRKNDQFLDIIRSYVTLIPSMIYKLGSNASTL